MFANLESLSRDVERTIQASPYTSIKQINEFINNGVRKLSQEFNLDHQKFSAKNEYDFEDGIEDHEHTQFVTDHNGADAELLKSQDWNAKKKLIK